LDQEERENKYDDEMAELDRLRQKFEEEKERQKEALEEERLEIERERQKKKEGKDARKKNQREQKKLEKERAKTQSTGNLQHFFVSLSFCLCFFC